MTTFLFHEGHDPIPDVMITEEALALLQACLSGGHYRQIEKAAEAAAVIDNPTNPTIDARHVNAAMETL